MGVVWRGNPNSFLRKNRGIFDIPLTFPKHTNKIHALEAIPILESIMDYFGLDINTAKIATITKQPIMPKLKYPKKHNSGYIELREFLNTELGKMKWQEVRFDALKLGNGKCCLCGRSAKDGTILHVDHIKPKSLYPELAFEVTNLQVLCEDCNMGKSNRDETDWR